jgi:zinc protease
MQFCANLKGQVGQAVSPARWRGIGRILQLPRLRLPVALALVSCLHAETRLVERPSKSPLVTIEIVFLTGAAAEPADKAGLADLTGSILAQGGSREMSYQQILDALFPMATRISENADKEMTVFSARTHVDNLEAFYRIFRAMLLDPGWREDDFRRLRDAAVNYLRVTLGGNNDEELAKEALYNILYTGTPYGRNNVGSIGALGKISLDDVKQFYASSLRRAGVVIGLAGGYPPEFAARVRRDFQSAGSSRPDAPRPQPIVHNRVSIIEKDTRSVALSLGYPIDVKRGDPDYPALMLATAYLGQHRSNAVGRLFQRMREARGLNYGDYAYIEYFPRGMFTHEPPVNLARRSQIFQIWIRPVEPPTAGFALRLALYELDKLVRNGLSAEEFETTRAFLSKYSGMLARTKSAELGYAIDSLIYGIPQYDTYVQSTLAKLTREQANAAIRRHLRADRLQIVAVSAKAEQLKQQLLAEAAPPMTYNAPKPEEIVQEDEIVRRWKLGLRAQDITIVPAAQVFE